MAGTREAGMVRPRSAVRLRLMMLSIVLIATALAWETNRARPQKKAVDTILRAGGTVLYEEDVDENGETVDDPPLSAGPAWKRSIGRLLGEDHVRTVRGVCFQWGNGEPPHAPSSAAWDALRSLPRLVRLGLANCQIIDADLAGL